MLDEVLTQLKEKFGVPEVLLPADDFTTWQREKLWERVLLNLDYLTFAWDNETEEAKEKRAQAHDGVRKMKEMVDRMYGLDDS